MAGQTALLIGATGLIGKGLLPQLLASSHFTTVGEFGRRVTSLDDLPATNRSKLEQHTINFDKIEEAGLNEKKWDVVFITLGTTKAIAGSKEAFTKIDHDYVVNAARAAKSADGNQRLVYLSTVGANPSSSVFYFRSKGQTEAALAELGYKDYIALRPGMFADADRSGTNRASERGIPWIQSLVSWVAPSAKIPPIINAMRLAGELGTENLPPHTNPSAQGVDAAHPHTVLYNDGVHALGQ